MKQTRKILIVATTKWTKKQEVAAIKEAIAIMQPAFSEITIDVHYRNFSTPETYIDQNGVRRITHDWFERHISDYAKTMGYHSSRLRFSLSEGRKWGLDSGIRGTNYADEPNDFHGEGWIRANATTRIKYRDGSSRLAYPKILAHEEGHELKHAGLTDLEIHDFDYQNSINNIEQFYKQLVDLDNRPLVTNTYIRLMLVKLINELLNRAIYPIPRKIFQNEVTQHWLVKNKNYESGYHNGLDVAVPIAQIVVAPQKGTIYLSGHTAQLGNYAFYECSIDGQQTYHLFPHLANVPPVGSYSRGQEIGRIGNTGLSTGPHLHWTVLRVRPVSVSHYVSLVNTREKIIKNTIDPYTFALYAVDRIKL